MMQINKYIIVIDTTLNLFELMFCKLDRFEHKFFFIKSIIFSISYKDIFCGVFV
jgi:hypothetical protein